MALPIEIVYPVRLSQANQAEPKQMPQIVLVGSTQNLAYSEYPVGPLPTPPWK